ncbi:MAG: DNA-binding response regulator [Deltaproteobacteria bacterium HGW-Deltaproteobacteria-10]|nr:MAG: DNA-binding response regulator [Deltaproteobacteria bacterium HGW-Deltaproteobacteria-10]
MSIRLFLVDDHEVIREGLKTLLESQKDMEVIGYAANGRTAVKKIKALGPDVVIMDITMPEMDGIEAARQVMGSCKHTKVIIFSMHSSGEHVERALHAGVHGYVAKESAGTEIIQAVRNVQAGKTFISSLISETVVNTYFRSGGGKPDKDPLDILSQREREILLLLVEGKKSAEIAGILHLSPKSVDTYRSRLMQKLSIHDLPGLVKFAIKQGLTTIP